MGLGNLVILIKTVTYSVAFVLAFFIFIPLAVNQSDFNGHCLLNARGNWLNNGTLVITEWGTSTGCNFSLFVGVATMFVCLLSTIVSFVHLGKGIDIGWNEGLCNMLLSCGFTILTFAAAITISTGFQAWCHLLNQNYMSCQDAQIDLMVGSNIISSKFYTQFGMAQFGLWSVWFCWLVLSIMWVFKMYKLSEIEDMKTAVQNERERLVHRSDASSI
ncbi:transmembrane protein 179-like [Tubulanus polymorphus]|uniref:transmembrane protein 179-like n=1 Tax=Tubulanus polymorphus TaxID=672921 RepID=UPI003DA22341